MFKQAVVIIVLSIAFIMMMSYAKEGLQLLLSMHDWVSNVLTNVFSGGEAGSVTRELLALLAAPILVGLIPVIIYWIVKRSWFPYFMECVWVIWLVQISALVILYNTSVS